MLLAYGIFAAFFMVILAVSCFVSYRQRNKVSLKAKTEIESLRIYLALTTLNKSYIKMVETGQLGKYPTIKGYMNEIKNLVDVPFYDFDVLKIKIKQLDNVSKKNFLDEVNRCPKGVKKLIYQKNEILFKIIFINNNCYKYIVKKDRLGVSLIKFLFKAATNKSLRNITINDEPKENKIKNDIDALLKESKNNRQNRNESSNLLLNRALSY